MLIPVTKHDALPQIIKLSISQPLQMIVLVTFRDCFIYWWLWNMLSCMHHVKKHIFILAKYKYKDHITVISRFWWIIYLQWPLYTCVSILKHEHTYKLISCHDFLMWKSLSFCNMTIIKISEVDHCSSWASLWKKGRSRNSS